MWRITFKTCNLGMRVGEKLGKICERLQRGIWVEMGQDKKEKIMGAGQSKEIKGLSRKDMGIGITVLYY